jgi:hypothetical protein
MSAPKTVIVIDADKPKKRPVPEDDSLQQDPFCCPICTMHYGPHIYQCRNGHCICPGCWKKLETPRKCPPCRVGMVSPTECLFALQQARALEWIHCAAVGCDFIGTYDVVCQHEASTCRKLHKQVPCMITQLLNKLNVKDDILTRRRCTHEPCTETHLAEDSAKHHTGQRTACKMAGQYATCKLELRITNNNRCQRNIMHQSSRGDFLVLSYYDADGGFLYIAVICMTRDTIPAGQKRIQLITKRPGEDENDAVGLRLEGDIMTAKDILAMPDNEVTGLDCLQRAISAHSVTFFPYIRNKPDDPQHRYLDVTLRW